VKARAYGKINLTLNVLKKREDGFHDLEMVMVPILLHDTLDIEIALEPSFSTNAKYLQYHKNNSIHQAIDELRLRYGFQENFAIKLMKYIPSQAGLGGGSSDGAATLLLLNELLGLKLSLATLAEIAVTIGKDLPFCLYGQAALVEGTGEKLTFIENKTDLKLLLVKPVAGVSTKQAYESITKQQRSYHDSAAMIKALTGGDYWGVVANLGNNFEALASDTLPEIQRIKDELQAFGFDGSLLCGSGSCVFALSQDDQLLAEGVRHFRKYYPFVWQSEVRQRKYD